MVGVFGMEFGVRSVGLCTHETELSHRNYNEGSRQELTLNPKP